MLATFVVTSTNDSGPGSLRQEIRQTARTMAEIHRRPLRPRVIWSGVGVAVVGSLVALVIRHPDYLLFLVVAHAFMLPLLAAIVGVVVHADTISKLAAQRRAQQEELIERLRFMPNDQIATALLPLRSDADADVRTLAKRLLREIELRSELAPATAPEREDDEISP